MYGTPARQLSVKAVDDCVGSEPNIGAKAVRDSHELFAIRGKYRGISPTGGGEFLDQLQLAIAPFKDARQQIRAWSRRLALNEIDLQQIQV